MNEPLIVKGPPKGPKVRIDPATAPRHYTRTDGSWGPRTYADDLSERGEDPRVRVRCPGCGRIRPAYAVMDFRQLPDDVRQGKAWGCECCREETIARAALDGRAGFIAALGGPQVVVERVRAAYAWQRRPDAKR